jgi:hypothetical protein
MGHNVKLCLLRELLESERAFQHERKRSPATYNALGPRLRGIRYVTG